MAKAKSKRIQIKGVQGKVCNLFFPPCTTKQDAGIFKTVARRMVQSCLGNLPFLPQDTAYVLSHGETVKKKLRHLGVSLDVQSDRSGEAILCTYLSRFTASKSGETERKLIATARRLERFFGPTKDMRDIVKTEASHFLKWLIETEKLAEFSTARRTLGYASQIMEAAVADGVITKNPFKAKDMPKAVLTDQKKHHYIDLSQTRKLWNAIQTDEDRIRFVLLRYLGLRAPSEIDALTWKDVNWEQQNVTIRSKKNEHHKNQAFRVCPITHPDVLPVLKAAYKLRTADDSPIVPRISGASLRKRVLNWLGRSGLEAWPQLLVNFRRTAVTDACSLLPSHVVAAYYGHSEAISIANYRMETAAHAQAFAAAPSMLQGA